MSLIQKISNKENLPASAASQPQKTSKIITKNGKQFLVTTELTPQSCAWQVARFFLALAATIFTLGFGLCAKPVKTLWKEALSGKKKITTRTPIDEPITRKTDKQRPRIEGEKPRQRDHRHHAIPKIQIDIPAPSPRLNPSQDRSMNSSRSSRFDPKQAEVPRADKIPGLQLAEYHNGFPKISDSKRAAVRETTRKAMERLDRYSPGKQPPRLYTSKYSENSFTKSTQLLGRFDVLQVQARMDYDHNWDEWQGGTTTFFVHHGAAINIGEGSNAEDFRDYSTPAGALDKNKFLQDTGRVFFNMLSAQHGSTAKHAVWFPFGMGAFLRHLDKNDRSYKDPSKLFQLRMEMAEVFIQQLESFPELEIHLCLPYVKNAGNEDATNQNYTAFITAISNASDDVKKRIKVYINVDATTLAQKLAKEKGFLSVSLANGANRNLIGNRWFQEGAKVAIDENLHRRSADLAAAAKDLNDGFEYRDRAPGELIKRVKALGGSSYPLES